MIRADQINDILSLYGKHGWTLRRVLLTPATSKHLAGSTEPLFSGAEIGESDIDAIWLSRAVPDRGESWELRRLSETGYALVEVFDEDDEEEVRDEIRAELEAKMRQT